MISPQNTGARNVDLKEVLMHPTMKRDHLNKQVRRKDENAFTLEPQNLQLLQDLHHCRCFQPAEEKKNARIFKNCT